MLVKCSPVGVTVTLWQVFFLHPVALPPAVAEWIVVSTTLYLSPLGGFRCFEKITVFADDNAIN